MSRTLRFVTCLIGLSILAGCTIAEPTYRPDLGGYAMIDEGDEKTLVSRQSARETRQLKS